MQGMWQMAWLRTLVQKRDMGNFRSLVPGQTSINSAGCFWLHHADTQYVLITLRYAATIGLWMPSCSPAEERAGAGRMWR